MCGFQAFQFPCQRLRRTEGKGNPPQPTFSSRIDNLTPSPRVRFSSWSSGGAAFQVNEPLGQTVPNSWMFVIIWGGCYRRAMDLEMFIAGPAMELSIHQLHVLCPSHHDHLHFFNRIQTVKYRQCLASLSKKVMSKFFKCVYIYLINAIKISYT